jgi:hypothetical protein
VQLYYQLPICKNSSASSPALAFVQRQNPILRREYFVFESMHVSVEIAENKLFLIQNLVESANVCRHVRSTSHMFLQAALALTFHRSSKHH